MKVEKLPIDYIKIDANFYNNDTSEIAKDLTEILFDFAKTRGIVIIAERIETLEQVNYFKEHNVVLNQGYLFSKPISSNELIEKIGNNGFIINALNNRKEEVIENDEEILPEEIISNEKINVDEDIHNEIKKIELDELEDMLNKEIDELIKKSQVLDGLTGVEAVETYNRMKSKYREILLDRYPKYSKLKDRYYE